MISTMNPFVYAEYAIGGINKRNNIQNKNKFKLNGEYRDCFRSIFLYDESLKFYVEKTGHIKGYAGKHTADSLVFDLDGDLNAVKDVTYNFVMHLYHEFDIPLEYMRIAFSGSKGMHVSIPMNTISDNIQPRNDFYKVYKGIAKDLATDFKFVDYSIYESKRLFRMTNTVNSKSGLYKIPLNYEELDGLTIDEIKELASNPRTITQLPLSEIDVTPRLNELYLKWNRTNFKKAITLQSKKDEILELLSDGASEGNRHNALIRITGALQKKNLDYEFILEILRQWNGKNNPPLDDDRLRNESSRAFDDNVSEPPPIYSLKEAELLYEEYISKIDNCKVKTGYDSVDKKIRGLMPGETMCILGKTSVGKSALLQNIGLNFAKTSGEPVLFFSLEMPITSVYERTLQIESGLTGYEIENAYKRKEKEIIIKANLVLNDIDSFYIITKTGLNLEQIVHLISFAQQHIYRKKTGLVLIDYLSLVKGSGKDLYEQTSRVARGMKDLAKELDVPVIFLSQVTKAAGEYDELHINSARDSGVIDEASDFVLALWKEKDTRTNAGDIPQMLGILKNRKGGLGKIKIEMDKRTLKIIERGRCE